MGRPIIGVCGALEQVRYGVWDVQAVLSPRSYLDAVARAGGQAIILPPDPATIAAPDEALDLLDGLILAGGADIDPGAYGAEPHPSVNGTVPERDSFEIALARRALERDLPLPVLKAGALIEETRARLSGGQPEVSRQALQYVSRRAVYPNDRARVNLGWEPNVDLRSGMARTETWLRGEGLI